ncbi:MAG: SLBB domain-containing protein [Gammaproteobacteria bacterium]|nr:MAG: hypothetical protein EVA53_02960 [Gammaproteobacteria bacterium]
MCYLSTRRRAAVAAILFFLTTQFAYTADNELSLEQEEMLSELPLDQQASIRQKILQANQLTQEVEDVRRENITLTSRPEKKVLTDDEKEEQRIRALNLIYGYDLFANAPTTFAPATDIPIPSSYLIGPGDLLSVNIIGGTAPKEQIETAVNREGVLSLPGMSPIGVGGLTLDQVRALVNEKLSSEFIGSTATISVKELRSMRIFVLGEAYMPGSYTVSSLTTISNALYISGGVSEKGSLRNIQIKRNGKVIQEYDLYDLLLNGDTSKDARLQPGDVIFIPIIKKKIRITGAVRRPALYELKDQENLDDVLNLASGLLSESLPSSSEVNRVNRVSGSREIFKINLNSEDQLKLQMRDGDIINIPSITALDEINVVLSGQFKYPGTYSVKNGEKLSDLMLRAGGFTNSAYLYGAVFTRKSVSDLENASYQRTADEMESAIASALIAGRLASGDIQAVSQLITRLRETKSPGRLVVEVDPIILGSDPEKDFFLENGDRIHVPPRRNSVTVVGDIYSPSTLPFKNSHSAKDYINQSGGYRWGADTNSVFLVLPDGQAKSIKRNIWKFTRNEIAPGTTIVVPKSTRPFDWLLLADTVTPILANLATSAAALAAIDD